MSFKHLKNRKKILHLFTVLLFATKISKDKITVPIILPLRFNETNYWIVFTPDPSRADAFTLQLAGLYPYPFR
jgi:hypothetical protein